MWIFKINEKTQKMFNSTNFTFRPSASHGFWLSFLLPLAIILSSIKYNYCTKSYMLASVFSFGLLLSAIIFLLKFNEKSNQILNKINIFSSVFMVAVFYYFTKFHFSPLPGILFSISSGVLSIYGYSFFLSKTFKYFPRSFSYGEASIVAQSVLIFLFTICCTLMYLNKYNKFRFSTVNTSTIILQFGILAVSLIFFISHKYQIKVPLKFYSITAIVIILIILLPLHIILEQSPVLWILNYLFDNQQRINMLVYWSVCIILATLSINFQINKGKRANTAVRKIFHILAVIVFVPGLIKECNLLFLASGVIFAIFIMLEIIRELNLKPIGQYLQDGYVVFVDEKDAGCIALTPIYLFVSCSIPLWIHPSPCDLVNSAGFNLLPLLSGIVTIGIGDTAASVFGYYFGKHKWKGSSKSIEGTTFCCFSQLIFLFCLMHLGFILKTNANIVKMIANSIIISIVEAKTDQVDNLVLPLISYIILIL